MHVVADYSGVRAIPYYVIQLTANAGGLRRAEFVSTVT